MLAAEYDRMMAEKGVPKVWIVDSALPNGGIYREIFQMEEEARQRYDAIPSESFRKMYRTWDIWGWTKRKEKAEYDMKQERLCECVFDITLVAAHLMREHQIEVEDSRELFQFCLGLATNFEQENCDIGDAYMDAIEEFAFDKLAERFEKQSNMVWEQTQQIRDPRNFICGDNYQEEGKRATTWNVTITETLNRTVTVEAESPADAEDLVRTMYDKGEIVLVAEDYNSTEIICDPEGV